MSVKIMSAIFETEFRDLELLPEVGQEKPRMAKASSMKLVLLAIADHANDEGESAYPGLTRLEKKTGMSRQGIIDVLSALKYNGILMVADSPSRLGTNDYTINLGCFPYLMDASQVTLLVKPLDQGSQATLPGVVKSLDLNHPLTIIESSPVSSKSKRQPSEGLPEPTGDALGDWLEMGRRVEAKHNPPAAVLEAIAAGFHYNFPHFGEHRGLDRVARLIAGDIEANKKDIQIFIAWAKKNKRDPHWYHVKPDSLWGDWPQAFADIPAKSALWVDPDEGKTFPVPDLAELTKGLRKK